MIFTVLCSSQPNYVPEDFHKVHSILQGLGSVGKLFPWPLISDSFGGNFRLLIAGKQTLACQLHE